jgi:hypothetical protein
MKDSQRSETIRNLDIVAFRQATELIEQALCSTHARLAKSNKHDPIAPARDLIAPIHVRPPHDSPDTVSNPTAVAPAAARTTDRTLRGQAPPSRIPSGRLRAGQPSVKQSSLRR